MPLLPEMHLPYTEESIAYLESRLGIRKFDLGVASAPLGVSVVMLDQIKGIQVLKYDCGLSVILVSFAFLALVSAIQIHRLQFAIGVIRSGLALGQTSEKFVYRNLPVWFNRLEIALTFLSYLIVLWIIWSAIWGVSFEVPKS
jgi:hypothetical protein